MPLIAHSDLPSFDRLREEGQEVLDAGRAEHQDIRELHIGLFNMMPDAALEATERQFLRLLGASNRIAQFYVHPFTAPGVPRAGAAAEHVARHYQDFDSIREEGLDALIITGANPVEPDITRETFWNSLVEVMDWARENVTSTYCSCLATHAALKIYHGVERTPHARKLWGVFSHRVVDPVHPLVAGINTRFDTPHSRWNDVPPEAMRAAGLRVLVASEEVGVLAATSPDGLRFFYFQGHPEYDTNSLLKEYKREVARLLAGEVDVYPPPPAGYFPPAVSRLFDRYETALSEALAAGREPPEFPEGEALPLLDNTWTDTGKALFNGWLGLVYQLTHPDRRRPFMEGVDPNDPLCMLAPCSPMPLHHRHST